MTTWPASATAITTAAYVQRSDGGSASNARRRARAISSERDPSTLVVVIRTHASIHRAIQL
jgi:hypothetical protein